MTISEAIQLGTLAGIAYVAFKNQQSAKVVKEIHTLSNSNMAAQLRIVWLQAKRIADLTKTAPDLDIAKEAERIYLDHVAKQALIDSGKSGTPGKVVK